VPSPKALAPQRTSSPAHRRRGRATRAAGRQRTCRGAAPERSLSLRRPPPPELLERLLKAGGLNPAPLCGRRGVQRSRGISRAISGLVITSGRSRGNLEGDLEGVLECRLGAILGDLETRGGLGGALDTVELRRRHHRVGDKRVPTSKQATSLDGEASSAVHDSPLRERRQYSTAEHASPERRRMLARRTSSPGVKACSAPWHTRRVSPVAATSSGPHTPPGAKLREGRQSPNPSSESKDCEPTESGLREIWGDMV